MKRSKHRAINRSKIGKPATVSVRLYVATATDVQLPDRRQVDRFRVNTANSPIRLDDNLHNSLQSARPAENVPARPVNQEIIQDVLHFGQLARHRRAQHMIVTQFLWIASLDNLLCSFD
jgi:hypothetical protein